MRKPKAESKPTLVNADEWEEKVVSGAFGDALEADGSIDFEKLRARGTTMTLVELLTAGIS